VHLYGRRPLGPTDRYEIWIKPPDGVERKFTVNTRHMPARRGHEVSLIVTAHQVPRVLALANWSTIAMVAGRAANRARLAWQVDRAIDLEAWRTSPTKSTQH
jgi:hypothetical protein